MAKKYDGTPIPSEVEMVDRCTRIIADAEVAFDTFYNELERIYDWPRPYTTYAAHKGWKTFLKLAQICNDNGWDVKEYIYEAMSVPVKNRVATLITDLVSPNVVAAVKKNFDAGSLDHSNTLQFCLNTLETAKRAGRSEISILMDPNIPFPAWFRVCYPKNLDNRLIGEWLEIAIDELKSGHSLEEFVKVNFSERYNTLMNLYEAGYLGKEQNGI